ncbi:hydroxysteroid dehydrogenase-like protein 1 [Musca domestica]|uniref:Hydroxysteroid dehydrogenase-like protein 1 n=1 Tax=Musca domestica TaxID=7370 RepID=A0ABM3UV17_MUSDO|nr:hydroxysteroid dehydrogenase-like protein 1 [Musca domestica]
MSCCLEFLTTLGAIVLLYFLYECLKSPVKLLYYQWLEREKKLPPLTDKYGKWAAITGSTDGIGKAYSRELARKGFNIVLIARNEEKLRQTAKEIEQDFGVEVSTIKADFSHGAVIYDKLFQDLEKRPIRLFVNNVGIGHNPPGIIPTYDAQHLWDMIHVNIAAVTQLSRHFVNLWLRQGVTGCLVNVSSILEMQPCPYGSVYGATKAYITSFTKALQLEVESFGINIQLLSPAGVRTKINKYSSWILKGNLIVPTAEDYAKWAVNTLGKTRASTGYFWHGIQTMVLKLMPTRWRSELIIKLAKITVDDTTNINEHDIRRKYGLSQKL